MGIKNIIGMIMTFIGIGLMGYGLYIGVVSHPHAISSMDALLFVFGTYFIIAGPAFWIGEVPREVIARVRKEALGGKGGS
jgi:hypothetical protein